MQAETIDNWIEKNTLLVKKYAGYQFPRFSEYLPEVINKLQKPLELNDEIKAEYHPESVKWIMKEYHRNPDSSLSIALAQSFSSNISFGFPKSFIKQVLNHENSVRKYQKSDNDNSLFCYYEHFVDNQVPRSIMVELSTICHGTSNKSITWKRALEVDSDSARCFKSDSDTSYIIPNNDLFLEYYYNEIISSNTYTNKISTDITSNHELDNISLEQDDLTRNITLAGKEDSSHSIIQSDTELDSTSMRLHNVSNINFCNDKRMLAPTLDNNSTLTSHRIKNLTLDIQNCFVKNPLVKQHYCGTNESTLGETYSVTPQDIHCFIKNKKSRISTINSVNNIGNLIGKHYGFNNETDDLEFLRYIHSSNIKSELGNILINKDESRRAMFYCSSYLSNNKRLCESVSKSCNNYHYNLSNIKYLSSNIKDLTHQKENISDSINTGIFCDIERDHTFSYKNSMNKVYSSIRETKDNYNSIFYSKDISKKIQLRSNTIAGSRKYISFDFPKKYHNHSKNKKYTTRINSQPYLSKSNRTFFFNPYKLILNSKINSRECSNKILFIEPQYSKNYNILQEEMTNENVIEANKHFTEYNKEINRNKIVNDLTYKIMKNDLCQILKSPFPSKYKAYIKKKKQTRVDSKNIIPDIGSTFASDLVRENSSNRNNHDISKDYIDINERNKSNSEFYLNKDNSLLSNIRNIDINNSDINCKNIEKTEVHQDLLSTTVNRFRQAKYLNNMDISNEKDLFSEDIFKDHNLFKKSKLSSLDNRENKSTMKNIQYIDSSKFVNNEYPILNNSSNVIGVVDEFVPREKYNIGEHEKCRNNLFIDNNVENITVDNRFTNDIDCTLYKVKKTDLQNSTVNFSNSELLTETAQSKMNIKSSYEIDNPQEKNLESYFNIIQEQLEKPKKLTCQIRHNDKLNLESQIKYLSTINPNLWKSEIIKESNLNISPKSLNSTVHNFTNPLQNTFQSTTVNDRDIDQSKISLDLALQKETDNILTESYPPLACLSRFLSTHFLLLKESAEQLGPGKFLWELIFPQTINPQGYYIVKLFIDGAWRAIVIDDLVPVINSYQSFDDSKKKDIYIKKKQYQKNTIILASSPIKNKSSSVSNDNYKLNKSSIMKNKLTKDEKIINMKEIINGSPININSSVFKMKNNKPYNSHNLMINYNLEQKSHSTKLLYKDRSLVQKTSSRYIRKVCFNSVKTNRSKKANMYTRNQKYNFKLINSSLIVPKRNLSTHVENRQKQKTYIITSTSCKRIRPNLIVNRKDKLLRKKNYIISNILDDISDSLSETRDLSSKNCNTTLLANKYNIKTKTKVAKIFYKHLHNKKYNIEENLYENRNSNFQCKNNFNFASDSTSTYIGPHINTSTIVQLPTTQGYIWPWLLAKAIMKVLAIKQLVLLGKYYTMKVLHYTFRNLSLVDHNKAYDAIRIYRDIKNAKSIKLPMRAKECSSLLDRTIKASQTRSDCNTFNNSARCSTKNFLNINQDPKKNLSPTKNDYGEIDFKDDTSSSTSLDTNIDGSIVTRDVEENINDKSSKIDLFPNSSDKNTTDIGDIFTNVECGSVKYLPGHNIPLCNEQLLWDIIFLSKSFIDFSLVFKIPLIPTPFMTLYKVISQSNYSSIEFWTAFEKITNTARYIPPLYVLQKYFQFSGDITEKNYFTELKTVLVSNDLESDKSKESVMDSNINDNVDKMNETKIILTESFNFDHNKTSCYDHDAIFNLQSCDGEDLDNLDKEKKLETDFNEGISENKKFQEIKQVCTDNSYSVLLEALLMADFHKGSCLENMIKLLILASTVNPENPMLDILSTQSSSNFLLQMLTGLKPVILTSCNQTYPGLNIVYIPSVKSVGNVSISWRVSNKIETIPYSILMPNKINITSLIKSRARSILSPATYKLFEFFYQSLPINNIDFTESIPISIGPYCPAGASPTPYVKSPWLRFDDIFKSFKPYFTNEEFEQVKKEISVLEHFNMDIHTENKEILSDNQKIENNTQEDLETREQKVTENRINMNNKYVMLKMCLIYILVGRSMLAREAREKLHIRQTLVECEKALNTPSSSSTDDCALPKLNSEWESDNKFTNVNNISKPEIEFIPMNIYKKSFKQNWMDHKYLNQNFNNITVIPLETILNLKNYSNEVNSVNQDVNTNTDKTLQLDLNIPMEHNNSNNNNNDILYNIDLRKAADIAKLKEYSRKSNITHHDTENSNTQIEINEFTVEYEYLKTISLIAGSKLISSIAGWDESSKFDKIYTKLFSDGNVSCNNENSIDSNYNMVSQYEISNQNDTTKFSIECKEQLNTNIKSKSKPLNIVNYIGMEDIAKIENENELESYTNNPVYSSICDFNIEFESEYSDFVIVLERAKYCIQQIPLKLKITFMNNIIEKSYDLELPSEIDSIGHLFTINDLPHNLVRNSNFLLEFLKNNGTYYMEDLSNEELYLNPSVELSKKYMLQNITNIDEKCFDIDTSIHTHGIDNTENIEVGLNKNISQLKVDNHNIIKHNLKSAYNLLTMCLELMKMENKLNNNNELNVSDSSQETKNKVKGDHNKSNKSEKVNESKVKQKQVVNTKTPKNTIIEDEISENKFAMEKVINVKSCTKTLIEVINIILNISKIKNSKECFTEDDKISKSAFIKESLCYVLKSVQNCTDFSTDILHDINSRIDNPSKEHDVNMIKESDDENLNNKTSSNTEESIINSNLNEDYILTTLQNLDIDTINDLIFILKTFVPISDYDNSSLIISTEMLIYQLRDIIKRIEYTSLRGYLKIKAELMSDIKTLSIQNPTLHIRSSDRFISHISFPHECVISSSNISDISTVNEVLDDIHSTLNEEGEIIVSDVNKEKICKYFSTASISGLEWLRLQKFKSNTEYINKYHKSLKIYLNNDKLSDSYIVGFSRIQSFKGTILNCTSSQVSAGKYLLVICPIELKVQEYISKKECLIHERYDNIKSYIKSNKLLQKIQIYRNVAAAHRRINASKILEQIKLFCSTCKDQIIILKKIQMSIVSLLQNQPSSEYFLNEDEFNKLTDLISRGCIIIEDENSNFNSISVPQKSNESVTDNCITTNIITELDKNDNKNGLSFINYHFLHSSETENIFKTFSVSSSTFKSEELDITYAISQNPQERTLGINTIFLSHVPYIITKFSSSIHKALLSLLKKFLNKQDLSCDINNIEIWKDILYTFPEEDVQTILSLSAKQRIQAYTYQTSSGILRDSSDKYFFPLALNDIALILTVISNDQVKDSIPNELPISNNSQLQCNGFDSNMFLKEIATNKENGSIYLYVNPSLPNNIMIPPGDHMVFLVYIGDNLYNINLNNSNTHKSSNIESDNIEYIPSLLDEYVFQDSDKHNIYNSTEFISDAMKCYKTNKFPTNSTSLINDLNPLDTKALIHETEKTELLNENISPKIAQTEGNIDISIDNAIHCQSPLETTVNVQSSNMQLKNYKNNLNLSYIKLTITQPAIMNKFNELKEMFRFASETNSANARIMCSNKSSGNVQSIIFEGVISISRSELFDNFNLIKENTKKYNKLQNIRNIWNKSTNINSNLKMNNDGQQTFENTSLLAQADKILEEIPISESKIPQKKYDYSERNLVERKIKPFTIPFRNSIKSKSLLKVRKTENLDKYSKTNKILNQNNNINWLKKNHISYTPEEYFRFLKSERSNKNTNIKESEINVNQNFEKINIIDMDQSEGFPLHCNPEENFILTNESETINQTNTYSNLDHFDSANSSGSIENVSDISETLWAFASESIDNLNIRNQVYNDIERLSKKDNLIQGGFPNILGLKREQNKSPPGKPRNFIPSKTLNSLESYNNTNDINVRENNRFMTESFWKLKDSTLLKGENNGLAIENDEFKDWSEEQKSYKILNQSNLGDIGAKVEAASHEYSRLVSMKKALLKANELNFADAHPDIVCLIIELLSLPSHLNAYIEILYQFSAPSGFYNISDYDSLTAYRNSFITIYRSEVFHSGPIFIPGITLLQGERYILRASYEASIYTKSQNKDNQNIPNINSSLNMDPVSTYLSEHFNNLDKDNFGNHSVQWRIRIYGAPASFKQEDISGEAQKYVEQLDDTTFSSTSDILEMEDILSQPNDLALQYNFLKHNTTKPPLYLIPGFYTGRPLTISKQYHKSDLIFLSAKSDLYHFVLLELSKQFQRIEDNKIEHINYSEENQKLVEENAFSLESISKSNKKLEYSCSYSQNNIDIVSVSKIIVKNSSVIYEIHKLILSILYPVIEKTISAFKVANINRQLIIENYVNKILLNEPTEEDKNKANLLLSNSFRIMNFFPPKITCSPTLSIDMKKKLRRVIECLNKSDYNSSSVNIKKKSFIDLQEKTYILDLDINDEYNVKSIEMQKPEINSLHKHMISKNSKIKTEISISNDTLIVLEAMLSCGERLCSIALQHYNDVKAFTAAFITELLLRSNNSSSILKDIWTKSEYDTSQDPSIRFLRDCAKCQEKLRLATASNAVEANYN